MTCNFYGRCLRTDTHCHRCVDSKFLKLPQDKIRAKRRRKVDNIRANTTLHSWQKLEAETAAIVSAVPCTIEMEAKVNPGSGNQPGRPGDNIDDVLFVEDKERKPNILAGGEKSIAIKKGWLDEAIKEARGTGKFPVVPFRYKGTEEIYCLSTFQTIASMAHEIKYLRNELYTARKMLKCAKDN